MYRKTKKWRLSQRRPRTEDTFHWPSSSQTIWTRISHPKKEHTHYYKIQTYSWVLKRTLSYKTVLKLDEVFIYTWVMLEKPMMKDTMQTMRMKSFFLFLRTVGYSSIRAVMKPSTVQNYHRQVCMYTLFHSHHALKQCFNDGWHWSLIEKKLL